MNFRVTKELLFQRVFQFDSSSDDICSSFINDNEEDEKINLTPEQAEYNDKVFNLIKADLENLKKEVKNYVKDFSHNQIIKTDLDILLIGLVELKNKLLPKEIIINECVELAKRYSTKTSGAFVNGVLASILKDIK